MGTVLVGGTRDNQREVSTRLAMRSKLRLVVCINQRFAIGQRSCVGSNNLEYIDKIRAMIKAEGLAVPIVERECLGLCEQGPVMRIAPGGRFFTEIDEKRLPDIVDELKKLIAESTSG